MILGAGRDRADAGVDHGVGIEVVAPVGTVVSAGDPVLVVMCDDTSRVAAANKLIDSAITIGAEAPPAPSLILETLN